MGSRFQSGVSRHWKGSVQGERRRSCRYVALHSDCHIGWWKDTVFEEKPAKLIDISMHGGLISMKARPLVAVGKSIWYRPVGIGDNEWIEATLVELTKPWLGRCQLRLNFRIPCRYETFKAIVYGTPLDEPASTRDVPEHEAENFWK